MFCFGDWIWQKVRNLHHRYQAVWANCNFWLSPMITCCDTSGRRLHWSGDLKCPWLNFLNIPIVGSPYSFFLWRWTYTLSVQLQIQMLNRIQQWLLSPPCLGLWYAVPLDGSPAYLKCLQDICGCKWASLFSQYGNAQSGVLLTCVHGLLFYILCVPSTYLGNISVM